MRFSYTPYALLYILSAVIALLLALIVARRQRAPGALACLVNLLALAEWSLSTALYVFGADVSTKLFWLDMMYVGVVVVPPSLLVFVARYTAIDRWLSRRWLALLCLAPVINIAVIWTNGYHHLQRGTSVLDTSGPFLVLHSELGPWVWVNALYAYTLVLMAFVLLVRAFRRSPRLYRRQLGAVILGALVPWVGTFLDLLWISPWPQIDLTPLLFTVTGAAFTVALVRFRMLDIVPVARDAIIESLDDAVLVLDTLRRVVDLNPAAQRLLGLASEGAIGARLEQIWPTKINLPQPGASIEVTIGDDTPPPIFTLRCLPFHARDGQTIGQLIVFHDITERRQAEAERLTLERKLQTAQKLESMGILAGGIAHDFNNLLGIILGNATLALAELPSDSLAREDLEIIRLTARRAAELTDQMLMYSGRGLLRVQRIELNEVLAEMSTLLRASLAPHVQLEMQLASHALPLLADTTQLRQVVLNLVINASEAIGDSAGTIKVSTALRDADAAEFAAYQLAPTAAGPCIVLKVADTGTGMSAETLPRIFEPFFTTKFLGRGLGLAAVQGIIRGHDGALRVSSVVGGGTTFTILLPCASSEQSDYTHQIAEAKT